MRRRCRPRVEPLELRDVPVGFIVPHPIPITSSPSTASLVLMARPPAPQPGQPVDLTLRETNTSGHVELVSVGSNSADVWVTQGGVEVWRVSKDGRSPSSPGALDGRLAPQQSRTFTAVWYGNFNEAAPPNPAGPFAFHGEEEREYPGQVISRILSLSFMPSW